MRSSPNVIWAMIGRSLNDCASETPASSSLRSLNVSNRSRSTPPSSRPSICSRKAARMSASRGLSGPCIGDSSGPIEPATSTSRLPATSLASRAICAARRLSLPARSARPNGASRNRLAPKEFVSMTSAPASMYSRWIAPIRSGRVSTSSSSEARCGTPRLNSSVPIAPSSRSGARLSRSAKRPRRGKSTAQVGFYFHPVKQERRTCAAPPSGQAVHRAPAAEDGQPVAIPGDLGRPRPAVVRAGHR